MDLGSEWKSCDRDRIERWHRSHRGAFVSARRRAGGALRETRSLSCSKHAIESSRKPAPRSWPCSAMCASWTMSSAWSAIRCDDFGVIHILMNNAGSVPSIKFTDVSDEQWYENLERKLLGYLRVTREVVPHLQKAGWGRIVNVAGTAGLEPSNTAMAVGLNNAAVINWTKSLSLQYASDGILVNTVAPGSIDTPRQVGNRQREAEVTGKSVEEIRQARVKDIPLHRLGRPEEVANLITFSRFGLFELHDRHLCDHRWRGGARYLRWGIGRKERQVRKIGTVDLRTNTHRMECRS